MLNFLPSALIGCLTSLLLGLNVIFWAVIVFALSILKFGLPFNVMCRMLDYILLWNAQNWISCNSAWMRLTQKTIWDVQGLENLDPHGWYLVISNHQSWSDIIVTQHLLNRRIPFMKFFLKSGLIWVPVIGLTWWALDFPFMRRHNAEYLNKRPEQRSKDFATTRKSCAKFATIPTSVMIYLEGTRFTKAKQSGITLSLPFASQSRRHGACAQCTGRQVQFSAQYNDCLSGGHPHFLGFSLRPD